MKAMRMMRVVAVMVGLVVTGTSGQAQSDPCANVDPPSGDCGPCEEAGVVCGESANPIRVASRNVHRAVPELRVWGGVGEHQLAWTRAANSRYPGGPDWFGTGQSWRHSYQWEMASAGYGKLAVHKPDGSFWRFDNVATNEWRTQIARAGMHMYQAGNNYTLQERNGRRYRFEKLGSGSAAYYQLQDFKDSQDNLYTLTYDANKRLTRVTEPAGRYLEIFYTQLPVTRVATGLLGKPANVVQGQWNELTVTNTNQYRYVRYTACSWCHASVAEIELVNAATNIVTGTAFGALPAFAAGQEPDKVNDGDTGTFYKYKYPQWGFVGVDFGDGNEQQISKIRFFPSGTMAYSQFEGMNELPELITVISEVRTSDGRSVTYEYEEFDDPSLPVTYQMLKAAQYGDGTASSYTHAQTYAGTRPLLAQAMDPRYGGAGVNIAYEYNLGTKVYGTILREKNGLTGDTIITVNRQGNSGSTEDLANGGQVTRVHFTSGGQFVQSRTDALGRKTEYTWTHNNDGYLNTIKDPLGRITTFDRTLYGNLLTNAAPDGAKVIWTRDAQDRVLSYTDELLRTTTYTRDAQGRITRTDHPDGAFELWTYNAFGQPLTHRLKNGGTESWTYDPTGLKLSHTDAEGNITQYEYDLADRLAAITDPRGNTTQYEYDERGQLTKIINADLAFRTFEYDAFGNRTAETDELGHTSTWTYDEFKRVPTQTDPLGHVTAHSYDLPGGICGCCHSQSTPTAITDPNGNTTTFGYDLAWQLTATTDPEGNTTSWTYDAAGNRKTQTDARGNTYTWNYDDRDRIISEVNALGQTTSFTYDAVGNRLSRTSATGEVTTWTYDLMNRMTGESSGTLAYEHDYDLADRRTEMRTRVNGVVTETTTFTHDLNHRLLTKTDPTGFVVSYQYDGVGNRTSLAVVPAGGGAPLLNVAYTYDTRNRVSTITGNDRTTAFSYDAASRRTAATWPNTTTATYQFDNAGRLTSLVHKTSAGADIASFAYQYDAAGNRTRMTTLEGANHYGYNKNNWLTSAAYPDGHSQQFNYDGVGNRTSLVETGVPGVGDRTTDYAYDAANRLQTEISNTTTNTYTFDAAGRLTAQTVNGQNRAYAYSFRSQMTGLSDTDAASGSYEFDADGSRVIGSAAPGGVAQRYVYDGPNVVLELESGIVKAAYVHDLGIDRPIERIQFIAGVADGRHVYHTDALGSVWVMTDDLQIPAKSYTYEAFGKIRSETGTGLLFPNRYTYTARESLGDSLGFYYYRWRVMAPRLGRFTSEDPLGFVDGPELYTYVGRNPTVYRDPWGLQGSCVCPLVGEIDAGGMWKDCVYDCRNVTGCPCPGLYTVRQLKGTKCGNPGKIFCRREEENCEL